MGYPRAYAKEKASGKGTVVLVPPRSLEDLVKAKKESLAEMYRLKYTGIPVKPHILLCAVCHFPLGAQSDAESVWTDGCGRGEVNNPNYEKGRKELMNKLGLG